MIICKSDWHMHNAKHKLSNWKRQNTMPQLVIWNHPKKKGGFLLVYDNLWEWMACCFGHANSSSWHGEKIRSNKKAPCNTMHARIDPTTRCNKSSPIKDSNLITFNTPPQPSVAQHAHTHTLMTVSHHCTLFYCLNSYINPLKTYQNTGFTKTPANPALDGFSPTARTKFTMFRRVKASRERRIFLVLDDVKNGWTSFLDMFG